MRPGFPFLGARYSILMHSRPSFFPEKVVYPSGLWICNFAKTTTMIPLCVAIGSAILCTERAHLRYAHSGLSLMQF